MAKRKRLKQDSAAAYGTVVEDRLESNNTGTPGFCSLGGIGRPQTKHRTKNLAIQDSGYFKLDHQKNLSQSFAANIRKESKQQRKNTGASPNEKTGTPSADAQARQSWVNELREIGRPANKCYPIQEETDEDELPDLTDSSSEEDQYSCEEDVDSDESTDCEHQQHKSRPQKSNAYAAKLGTAEKGGSAKGKTSQAQVRRRQKPAEPIINACIARSVAKEEMEANPKAVKAKDTEWGKLWDQKVWDSMTFFKKQKQGAA